MDKTTAKRANARADAKAPMRAAGGAEEDGTRERILRTAERLFAERGFNGVSVRELAAAAQVNIASIGYHFDSKEGLLSEVYRRHCEPLIAERLRGLEAAARLRGKARVAAIIAAFVRPALQQVEIEDGATFMRLRAVLSGENSELLEKLVAENFDQSSSAFIDKLCECRRICRGPTSAGASTSCSVRSITPRPARTASPRSPTGVAIPPIPRT
jgi:AcrR family transcriptional regulator